MALRIISINPENNKLDTSLDSKIIIEVDNDIDPFTVSTGISIYTKSDSLWSGPDLSTLDTKFSDVLDIQKENTYYPFTYQISNRVITITPSINFIPDREHFITIYPGNNVTRYLSENTIVYIGTVAPTGNTIEITSAYSGLDNKTFDITFSSSNGENVDTIDVMNGVNRIGSFPYSPNSNINIGELSFTLRGNWDIDNSIEIQVKPGHGLTSIYETKFTTSKFTTITPKSKKIDYISDNENPLQVISTLPEDMTIDNKLVNPVVIKFNKPLKPLQDLSGKIKIKRKSLETGFSKNINYYYKIQDNTVKIFMLSVARETVGVSLG